ncbi:erythromycin esterase family protein [Sulfuricystis multivorans]|uniref:erythromycin esterase family protein n=1 Tax=Sulfuricystis multivorans TaxID=2211108 RepID=UPI000F8448F8|nr:erythromycin esterase family protein [Sulfuricystis multivorans]
MHAGTLTRFFFLMFAVVSAQAADWRAALMPWRGIEADFAPLLADVASARTVLIGEATHGTHEFLVERARISLALIERAGFEAVLIEAPWAPLLAVDDYVRGAPLSARQAVAKVEGFPRWVVHNPPFIDFIESLRRSFRQVRLLGFDLYSLPESAEALIAAWQERSQPVEAQRAAADLHCFFDYREEPMLYGLMVQTRAAEPCGAGARRQAALWSIELAESQSEESFRLRWHAQTVVAAEDYYRAIYRAGDSSWNRRERHLLAIIEGIRERILAQGGQGKLVVWAHNTHVGDARATAQAHAGELSLGQLLRERHGVDQVFLLGMTTRLGTVRAADRWGGKDRIKRLRPARPGSVSAVLGQAKMPAFYLRLRDDPAVHQTFSRPMPDRAIGVVYTPATERRDHYFEVRLSEQFDAVLHLDATHALEPLPQLASEEK